MKQYKIIKLREVVDAIRKDGLPKHKGSFFHWGPGDRVISGCALGQAALNLDVDPEALWTALPRTFRGRVVNLNDQTDLTLPQIADKMEEFGYQSPDQELIVQIPLGYTRPPVVEPNDAPG
jgi:hypothetical protein